MNEHNIYENPTKVETFYKKLAKDINTACDSGNLDCNGLKNPYLLQIRTKADVSRLLGSVWKVFDQTYSGMSKRIEMYDYVSRCSEPVHMEQIHLYKKMTNSTDDLIVLDEKYWFTDDWQVYKREMIQYYFCLLYTSPSPRDATLSRMPSSA